MKIVSGYKRGLNLNFEVCIPAYFGGIINQFTVFPMAVSYQTRKRDEQEMRRRLEEEFSSLDNAEALNKCVTIIDNGVEEGKKRGLIDFDNVRENILNLSELSSPVRIMDFGGGTGTPMSAICKRLRDLNKNAIVSVEEPHKESLQKYKKCIEKLENATLDVAYLDDSRIISGSLWKI
ncbi:uncharacterized protein LOC106178856 [Lingula anatina]|uniref:Uncharacterized protein LOC106178856 n=1 Tax=Lingula anatina TaxID=7574 RepID=A0A1S3K5Y7_LINAN|nr:uncharacterized protein LOC106178856 [Lingula anatina]|eukprot:XP_013417666.1 uncharacterized protein LOC106178856 [Lingula anatina]